MSYQVAVLILDFQPAGILKSKIDGNKFENGSVTMVSSTGKTKMKRNIKVISYGAAALALLFGRYPISWLLSSRNINKLGRKSKLQLKGSFFNSPSGNSIWVKSNERRDKPAIVFIHGINSNSLQWQHQEQFFCNHYHVISIDLPGHGASPVGVNHSIEAISRDLSYVLTDMNTQNPILYGHSLGGMIIQEYCRQNHSPFPKAIILQNCSYTNPLKTMPISPIPWLLQTPLIKPALKLIARHNKGFTALGFLVYTSGISSLFYRLLLFTGKQSAVTLRIMASFAANTEARTTAETVMETFTFNLGKSLEKIDIPFLVLGATEDRIIELADIRRLHLQLPGSELKVLKGGHQTMVEFPKYTNQAIFNFLRKHKI